MMRANVSPERLQEIRKELGVTKFQAACRTRNRHRVQLIKARSRYDRASELMAYHRRLGNPAGVAKYAAEAAFAKSLIDALERRITRL